MKILESKHKVGTNAAILTFLLQYSVYTQYVRIRLLTYRGHLRTYYPPLHTEVC